MKVMLNQKITILLLWLMYFSSVNGFSTVICRGADGHIAVEPAAHNHCECPRDGKADEQNVFGAVVEACVGHNSCTDTLPNSNYVVPVRQTIKVPTHKVLTAIPFLKSISIHTTSFFGYLVAQRNELSSFFMPLQTVIILA